MTLIRPITRADIKGPKLYAGIRDDFRNRVIELKRPRRVILGDRVSLVFENRHTLLFQIEEMLRAESIASDEGIQAEIDVYNELMPNERSLSATLFIELPTGADAYVELKQLVGLDEHLILHVGERAIRAAFEPGRSTEDKISAVQYVRFPLDDMAKAALLRPGTPLALEIDHPNYGQKIVLGEDTRASLARDYQE
jgi:hypothetical protein